MTFREFLKNSLVLLDGGMGTLLQASGLQPGEAPEEWNLSHPCEIERIHRAYFDAGSNVVNTNTFGVSGVSYDEKTVETLVFAAVENAKKAREGSSGTQEKFIALDIGPTGRLLQPMGELSFEDAVAAFAVTVRAGVKAGADLVMIETMNDSLETKAAVLAAKENSDLPILAGNAYSENGCLMTGASPEAMVALLEGLGVDALGLNCSFGPEKLRPVAEKLLAQASVPVLFKPNAGLPRVENGKTVFDVGADEFADSVASLVKAGVRAAGGCCGTTPDYIHALRERVRDLSPVSLTEKTETVVSSGVRAVTFDRPVLIGERINPTGKKRFRQALIEHDINYLLEEGLKQARAGVHVLDVNVGIPDIDEESLLPEVVTALQAVTDLPLQLDTVSPAAMEKAMRLYNGKPLVNSVSGKEESLKAILPLVKKYGGAVIALTLDENGIPETAQGRLKIAEKILARAKEAGIPPRDVIFDPLTMTVSADRNAGKTTLEAMALIREKTGCRVSLGVSNASFGLPHRELVNRAFFVCALEKGLDAAIMNPFAPGMLGAYYAFCAAMGLDENCRDYLSFCDTLSDEADKAAAPACANTLSEAIRQGLEQRAAELAEEALKTDDALTVINREVIPALDAVGQGYEAKTLFLPQLLMSASAAGRAFDVIRASNVTDAPKGMKVVLATVKGDVHDIGKNIVRMLLENYGFDVIDLGRDVPPEQVLAAVLEHRAPVAGLSALMTTTVPAMEETVRLLHEKAPFCQTVVGGAVLTQEYAQKLGADAYAADATETVRFAERVRDGQV